MIYIIISIIRKEMINLKMIYIIISIIRKEMISLKMIYIIISIIRKEMINLKIEEMKSSLQDAESGDFKQTEIVYLFNSFNKTKL